MVEAPNDTVIAADGAALMAYQYFENVRNFLVVVRAVSGLEGPTATKLKCRDPLEILGDHF